jgi:hypothetical protein
LRVALEAYDNPERGAGIMAQRRLHGVVAVVSVALCGISCLLAAEPKPRLRREVGDLIRQSRAPGEVRPDEASLAPPSPPESPSAIPVSIQNGRAWLQAHQNANGSWGTSLPITDTGASLEALATLDPCTTNVANGAAWLGAQVAPNYEFLARQASGLARAAGSEAVARGVALSLLGVRRPAASDGSVANWPEGGWGIADGYESDSLTTALALLALDRTGFNGGFTATNVALGGGATNTHVWEIATDATKARILITVTGSTVRLRMKQGSPPTVADPYFALPPGGPYLIVFPDSGLPFTPGTNYITIQSPSPPATPATYTMTASYQTPDLDTTALAEPLNYLRQSQNVDGGWGLQRGQATDLYTTLHVILSLQRFNAYEFSTALASGVAYVKSQQLVGGSFGYDGAPVPYVTALAALGLVRAEAPAFSTATQNAISALNAMQMADGSWSHQAYDTALAVSALWEYGLPPKANAGQDRTVTDTGGNCIESVGLAGSGTDSNGTISTYAWTESCTPIATGASPSVSLVAGTHVIVLTVTDNDGYSARDSVTISVIGPDADGDGRRACANDCNDANASIWAAPGEVVNALFQSRTVLAWTAPADLGGTSVVYDVVRSTTPSDFQASATCVESNDGLDTQAVDSSTPASGTAFYYLVRAENACASGQGPLSPDPELWPRVSRSCP